MKKRTILPALLLLAVLPVTAQKLRVAQGTVDVGRTGYQTPVTAVFEFRNKGGKKVRIESVNPDCHCTTVEYPHGALGDKFQIRMTYDARQLGHFDKQAAVVYSGGEKPIYIRMKGVVLEGWKDYSTLYPVTMGDLLLDKSDLEFDNINRGDTWVQEIHLFNNGSKACRPNLMHLPSYLSAVTTPERLAPGQGGAIAVTLNSSRLRDYGLTQSLIYLAANPGDKVNHDNEITVSAVMLPAFDGMTDEQRQRAPRIHLSREEVDITFGSRSKKKETIDITNNGQTELDISSLQLFTGGLEVSLSQRHLQPGQSARLKVTALRDELKKVRSRPRILMITNDPTKPKVAITINVH